MKSSFIIAAILLCTICVNAAPIDYNLSFNILLTGSDQQLPPLIYSTLLAAGHNVTLWPYSTFYNGNSTWLSQVANESTLIIDASVYTSDFGCTGPCKPREQLALVTALSNLSRPILSTKVRQNLSTMPGILYVTDANSPFVSTVTVAITNFVTAFMGTGNNSLFRENAGNQTHVHANFGGIGPTYLVPSGFSSAQLLLIDEDTLTLNNNVTRARSGTFAFWSTDQPGYNFTSIGNTLFLNSINYLMQTFLITQVVDANLTGIPVNMTVYYKNGTLANNSFSLTGTPSPEIYRNFNQTLEFRAFTESLQVQLNEINPLISRNQTFGMNKRLNHLGFLGVYSIMNNYTFSNATVTINYDDLPFADETDLDLFLCSSYNFTNQSCPLGWVNITNLSVKNLINHTFTYNTTSFSAFAISGGGVTLLLEKTDSPDPLNLSASTLLNYTITINVTNGTAFNITLQDLFPPQVTVVNSTPAPNMSNNTWIIGNLTENQSFQVNITVNVNIDTPNGTVINNTANITFQNGTGSIVTGNVTRKHHHP